MSNKRNDQADPNKPIIYQIRVQGHLTDQWQPWFEGLTITLEEGTTLLTGPIVDQAALYGFLRKIRDLGLPLLTVIHVESGKTESGKIESDK